MRLHSQGSQFVFNLPPNFIPQETINTYTPLMEKNWVQYDNVLDYLNSTIKSVSFTGLSVETPQQHLIRGKTRDYKSSKNHQDIITSRTLDVVFASVDADINYWIIFDIFQKHYLDVENMYLNPFILMAVDINRDGIYQLSFREIILTGLSENRFDYSQQKISPKDFTLTFSYNFYDIEFLMDRSKVLELSTVPTIIQKI